MKTLTKLFAAASVAASMMAFAAPANAITYISPWTVGPNSIGLTFGDDAIADATGPGIYNGTPPATAADGTSTHNNGGSGIFTDTFSFTLPRGDVGFVLNSISFTLAAGVIFDSVDFNGTLLTLTNTPLGTGNLATAVTMAAIPVLNGGPQLLTIHGHGMSGADTTGVWSGTGTFAPTPEPATWGLMIMGFGGMGMMLRRRRQATAFA